jgi:hypothetical protein
MLLLLLRVRSEMARPARDLIKVAFLSANSSCRENLHNLDVIQSLGDSLDRQTCLLRRLIGSGSLIPCPRQVISSSFHCEWKIRYIDIEDARAKTGTEGAPTTPRVELSSDQQNSGFRRSIDSGVSSGISNSVGNGLSDFGAAAAHGGTSEKVASESPGESEVLPGTEAAMSFPLALRKHANFRSDFDQTTTRTKTNRKSRPSDFDGHLESNGFALSHNISNSVGYERSGSRTVTVEPPTFHIVQSGTLGGSSSPVGIYDLVSFA